MFKYLKKLHIQVLLGFAVGALIGFVYPSFGVQLLPLAEAFIKLIKMMLAPIVFCFVVTGILHAGDLKTAGRVALKTIIYFEIVTTIALLIGVFVTYVLKPGVGMNIDVSTLDPKSIQTFVENASHVSDVKSFLLNIIPSTFLSAFAKGDILQVLLIAVLFGCALQIAGEKGKMVGQLMDSLSEVLFRVIGFIVRLSPLGVAGAMAFTVGKFGFATIQQLGQLVLAYYAACAIFLFLVLGVVMRLSGLSLFKFIGYLKSELLIALGSSSSDAVMPLVMAKLRHLGVKETTVGLVIPTGYSFNLDGFSIWLTCAVIFIAQATNTPLEGGTLALILLVSLLTSKGAHGIPGSATVVLAATLTAIPAIPVLGVALILSVDKLMGFFRVALNLIGNCVGAVAIAAWEGHLDLTQARRVLQGDDEFVSEENKEMRVAGNIS
ncbi:C4-dicarboxylate transport protein 2 [Cupriavidus necator]|uniref:C4-dicarboxylate transport protein n=1 Tax=Cupriavidus necator (strain ATCC 17699 / DSM 428 / KCTC 22496 / NCIMB 10442 / H16 / Stanier 337) TaxID=381666 RepID=Q0JYD8_CUPNH|nr:C4-dicarboxylate transporter DctA [Cupriavidus necator]KUE88476.1 C4-dicarboxylate ABC transporter [Cupriavidus necator]QCC05001.1 C4-dicarboxylate transporter DctA [Cupriavidus necator H16]QQB79689.1 C4-dicarboxylate transporter DctA [Cupriavidus necator]WKA43934.1 C4-dicarboxylate transporter DctA [Cupriavidus necator]CAJ97236.1 C4-dicarboxylate transport protein [Cupriavidus necator H16]